MRKALYLAGLMVISLQAFGQFSPNDWPGLSLWLRSDTLVEVEGVKVASWGNIVGEDAAVQVAANLQPNFETAGLGGFPAIRFGGFNDFMYLEERTDVHTVFVVASEFESTGAQFRSILGHSSAYDFHRGPNRFIWHETLTAPGILNGTTRLNFETIDGTSTTFPESPSLFTVVSQAPLSANQLSVDRTLFERVWGGDWFELLVFNTPLSPAEVDQVENYLADRYMPAFEPLADVVNPGFCDSTICAPAGFAHYFWNGVEGTSCYTTTDSESLSLTVVDDFGRATSQTISVTYPGLALADDTICAGQTAVLDSGLPAVGFSISWGDGSSDQTFEADQAGTYGYSALDEEGCSVSRTMELTVDAFPTWDVLPDTADLCQGNVLSPLQIGADFLDDPAASLEWNGNTSALELPVFTAGWQVLSSTNSSGCTLDDSTFVNILGAAPDVDFSYETVCQGTELTVTDASSTQDGIAAVSWFWNGSELTGLTVELATDEYGWIPLEVQALTTAGCIGELDTAVYVLPNPEVSFVPNPVCRHVPFELQAAAGLPEAGSLNWAWEVEGEVSEDTSFTGVSSDSGFLDVTLQVTSDAGCATTQNALVPILPSPLLDIVASGAPCVGADLGFSALFDCPDCTGAYTWLWQFGDETFSSSPTPDHFYTQPGGYDVMVQVMGDNGCLAQAVTPLSVTPFPTAASEAGLACAGSPVTFSDASDLPGISSWEWDGQVETGNEVSFTFPSSGGQAVLHKHNSNGCVAEEWIEVLVNPSVDAGFTWAPTGNGLEFIFTADADYAEHVWSVGGDLAGEATPFAWNFASEGDQAVAHSATAQTGCSADTVRTVDVSFPQLDVALVALQSEDGWITARVQNRGNYTTGALHMRLGAESTGEFFETWETAIPPESFADYTFASQWSGGSETAFCAEVFPASEITPDIDPSNNRFCLTTDEVRGYTVFPPYPNPVGNGCNIGIAAARDLGEFAFELLSPNGQIVRALKAEVLSGFTPFFLDTRNLRPGLYVLRIADSSGETERFNLVVQAE